MHPFVKDREDFDRLGARAIRMLGDYLRALPAEPVDRVVPKDVRQRLISLPLPEHGHSPEEILDFLRREIMPWPIATGHKRSYGWVNSRRRRSRCWRMRSPARWIAGSTASITRPFS